MTKKGYWDDDYIRYGSTFITENDGSQQLQFILDSAKFSNSTIKLSKLDEHFTK